MSLLDKAFTLSLSSWAPTPRHLGRVVQHERACLFGLFLIAVAARLAVLPLGIIWNPDSFEYLRQAEAIVSGRLVVLFPNGYPLVIAPLTAYFDRPALDWAIGTLNAILSAAVAPMSFVILRRINLENRIAVIGGLAIALWPHQINYVRQVMSESAITFWSTLFTLLLIAKRPNWAGLALAAAVLTRPAWILCAPFVMTILPRREALRFAGSLAAILLFYATAQNAFGGVFGLSGNLTMNLALAADWDNFHPRYDIDYPSTFSEALGRYVASLWNSPLQFIGTRLANLWDLFGPWPLEEVRGPVARFVIGLRFPMFIAFVVGIFSLLRDKKFIEVAALAFPVLAITIVHTALFAYPRFSVPIEPVLIVGAFVGIRRFVHLDKA